MENTEKPKPKLIVLDKVERRDEAGKVVFTRYFKDVENKELYTAKEIIQAFLEESSIESENRIKEYEAQQPPALKEKIAALEEQVKQLQQALATQK